MAQQKDVILNLLHSLVSGQNLQAAEKKLAELSTNSGYGMVLLSIFSNGKGNGSVDDSVRQQSGILLKNFVSRHWETGKICEREKNAIKAGIVSKSLFQDRNSKLRKTAAMIISVLAEFDYPEKWSNLLDVLLSMVKEACTQQNVLLLSGSVLCLQYFVEHICDLQIAKIGPVLFPLLLQIFCIESLDVHIRDTTLSVYHNLLSIALDLRLTDSKLTQQLIDPTILRYLQFINDGILKSTDRTLLPLQMRSLQILNDITKSYPSSIAAHLPTMLLSAWTLMLFHRENGSDSPSEDTHQFFDDAFAWVLTILRHQRAEISNCLDDKLNDICSLTLKLLNLDEADMQLFGDAPNEFIANEENIYLQNNLRALIRSVVITILEVRPRTGYYSLLQSAKRTLATASSSMYDRESVLLVFGVLAQFECSSAKQDFKIEEFLSQVLWKDLHNEHNPLIQYRALTTLTQFVSSLNLNAKKSILPQVVQCMKSAHPLCVRYAAVRCFEGVVLCNNHRDASKNIGNIGPLLDGVMPMLCHLMTKLDETTLKYALKALVSLIRCNKTKCAEYEAQIVPLIIKLWGAHRLDQDITHHIKRVVSVYASIESCQQRVIEHVVPAIESILGAADEAVDECVTNCSLQILHILMMNSLKPNGPNCGNDAINKVYYAQFLPRILGLVYAAEPNDCALIDIGAKILCLLINSHPERIVKGSVEGGRSMTECVCQIIAKLLSPEVSEEASNGVGPLINQLVLNLKCTLNDAMFTQLLLTIITRIDRCQTALMRNQLLLVFARLVLEYGDVQMVEFLSKHQKLGEVLALWCANHSDFIYPYYKKLSVTALAKLLQCNHSLLATLAFDGYPIINIHAPRASRSRSTQMQYTQMPFAVKFMQLLIHTFRDLVETEEEGFDEEGSEETFGDEDEDDELAEYEVQDMKFKSGQQSDCDDDEYNPDEEGDSEEEDDDDADYEEEAEDDEDEEDGGEEVEQEQLGGSDNVRLLQSTKTMSHCQSKGSLKDIELERCPEAANDQVFKMDFGKWCREFTQNMSKQNGNAFQGVVSMLNEADRRLLLQRILN